MERLRVTGVQTCALPILIEFEVMCLPPLECEVIKLRYVEYGVAKSGYWEKVAQRMHVSQDWAKALERHGVERLINRIAP